MEGSGGDPALRCPLCGEDFSSYSLLDKEVHLDACFERSEGRGDGCAPASPEAVSVASEPAAAIADEGYVCPVCGRGFPGALGGRIDVEARLRHLKECARANGVGPRDLIERATQQSEGTANFDTLLEALTPPEHQPQLQGTSLSSLP